MNEAPAPPPAALAARVPRAVLALGLTSLCMDLSSELVHSLLPVFLVGTLGAGALAVGLVEGVADATASFTRVFSGALSDRLGSRKSLALSGYGLAALVKPLFPLADSVAWVLVARFADRVGKGMRGAPRDALVADLTPPAVRGAAYGLRQALDTVGAFGGPLAAMGLMAWLADDVRGVLWFALIPAWAAVAVLAYGVREPRRARPAPGRAPPLAHALALGGRCFAVVGFAAVMQLARFSEAFLVLRASSVGIGIGLVPAALVSMNITYALSAYPAGRLSDRAGPRGLLAAGLLVLVAADVVLAAAHTPAVALAGAALWGLHMGLTQGLLAAAVAASAPAHLRGGAFGVLHLASGVALLLASVVAGWLWQAHGPAWTFAAGACLGVLALALLPALVPPRP